MIGHALTYATDGTVTALSPLCEAATLDWLQKQVGGYIEVVPGFERIALSNAVHPCVAFCNEEGKLKGLPVNHEATRLWAEQAGEIGDYLVGPIVVLFGDAEFMDSL